MPRQELIKDVAAVGAGSALIRTERYRRMTVIGHARRPVGPLAGFLAEGWDVVPGSSDPEFGFRGLSRGS